MPNRTRFSMTARATLCGGLMLAALLGMCIGVPLAAAVPQAAALITAAGLLLIFGSGCWLLHAPGRAQKPTQKPNGGGRAL